MSIPDHNSIKAIHSRLIAVRDSPKNANEAVTNDLAASQAYSNTYCCADPAYQAQVGSVKATMPSVITDDTVGEHLYGCFQPELAIEIACTPACADGGLRNPNLTACDTASYEKKGELKKLNDLVTEDANVFIASGNTITTDDRAILRNEGVKVITVYNQDGNSINYILGESVAITPEDPAPTPNPGQSQSTTSNWGWVWIVVAIVLIVLLVFFMFRAAG